MRYLVILCLLLIGACNPNPAPDGPGNGNPDTQPRALLSGSTVVLECLSCEEVDNSNCDNCSPGTNGREFVDGILVKFSDKPSRLLYKPINLIVRGATFTLEDYRGTRVSFNSNQTTYGNVTAAINAITACLCNSGSGGGGSDGVLSSGSFNSGTGVLTLNISTGGSVNITGFPTGSGGSGSNVTNVSFASGVLTVTTDEPNTFNVNINAGNVNTTSATNIGGTNYPAGTDLQTIIDAIVAEMHPAAVLSSNAAPFSWNTVTQAGNIPIPIFTDNGGGSYTYNPGDGTAVTNFSTSGSTVNSTNSVTGDGSVGDPLQLVNDNVAPGNSYYYGTDGAGTKGFFPLTTGGLQVYDAEAGAGSAMVKATAAGVTFSRAGGIGTFSIPSGVEIVSARIEGVTADLGGANDFQVVFDYATSTYNTGIADMFMPMIQVVNTAAQLGGGPTSVLPFIQDEGSDPQPQPAISVSGGDLTARVINLNAFSNWTLMLNL